MNKSACKMGRLISQAFLVVLVAVLIQQLFCKFSKRKLPLHFEGTAEKGWEPILETFRNSLDDGTPSGAAFAVYHEGKLVVDAWGGYMDIFSGRRWERDTVTCAFSVTKAVVGLAVAVLVDRGLLSYDDLVTKYWPEFGQHGKNNVTVKMLLSHQAGVPAAEEPITVELMHDWRSLGDVLAQQKPYWPPGTAHGYHALTYGFLVDQVVRRVDPKGRSLGKFVEEEITKPNGIHDFRIGWPKEHWHRMAQGSAPAGSIWVSLQNLYSHPSLMLAMIRSSALTQLSMSNPKFVGQDILYHNHPELFGVEIGAANGVGTARDLAKMFSLLATGKLVNPEIIAKLSAPVNGIDGSVAPFSPGANFLPDGWGFFHIKGQDDDYILAALGYGGQAVITDTKKKLVFAYLRNSFDLRLKGLVFEQLLDKIVFLKTVTNK